MKLQDKKDSKVKTFGAEGKATEFTMLANAKAFSILIDGIYEQKIKAIIRELSTNARDSHISAGNADKQFIVFLPTNNDPEFYIEDFGVGLSEEQVDKIYSTFFASDKENSNDFTGCLGLGSKTPFCYNTKSFVVESWFNGIHYIYSCFINDYGIPSYIKLSSDESPRENGVKISFPVARYDIYEFARKAEEVYKHFDLPPKILGSKIEIPKINKVLDFADWSIIDDYGSYVLMGNIAYPINKSITNLDDLAKNCNIEFRMPIGTVEMDSSREGLSYTKKTIKAINDKCTAIKKEIQDKVEKDIATAKSLYQAALFLHTYQNGLGDLLSQVNLPIKWNNQVIPKYFDFHNKTYLDQIESYSKYSYGPCRKNITWDIYPKHVVVDDLGKGSVIRTKQFIDASAPINHYRTAYLVHIKSDPKDDNVFANNLADFLKDLGAEPDDVQYASKLPYTKATVSRKSSNSVKLCEFMLYNNKASYAKDVWQPVTTNPTGGLYVVRKAYQLIGKTGNTEYYYDLRYQLNRLAKIDNTITTTDIYGVRQSDVEDLGANWECVWDYIDRHTESLKKKWLDVAHQKSANLIELNDSESHIKVLKRLKGAFNDFDKIVIEWDQFKKDAEKDLSYCNDISTFFGYGTKQVKPEKDFQSILMTLFSKYPGLEWCRTQSYHFPPPYILINYIKAVDANL